MLRVKHFGGGLLTALLWAGVLAAVPLVGVRWVDSSVGTVPVLQSMIPMTGVLVAVLVLSAAVTRRWRITAVAGVLLTVCAAIAVPTVFGHTVAPGRDDLVVMSANLEYGGADAQALVAATRKHRVDVLVLLEITPAARATQGRRSGHPPARVCWAGEPGRRRHHHPEPNSDDVGRARP